MEGLYLLLIGEYTVVLNVLSMIDLICVFSEKDEGMY